MRSEKIRSKIQKIFNKLSRKEKDRLFKEGLKIINGGKSDSALDILKKP